MGAINRCRKRGTCVAASRRIGPILESLNQVVRSCVCTNGYQMYRHILGSRSSKRKHRKVPGEKRTNPLIYFSKPKLKPRSLLVREWRTQITIRLFTVDVIHNAIAPVSSPNVLFWVSAAETDDGERRERTREMRFKDEAKTASGKLGRRHHAAHARHKRIALRSHSY